LYLHKENGTFKQYAAAGSGGCLAKNYLMALLTGVLWYGQFFFYGLGHVRMGNYKFTSWAIHMIMLVLFSSVAGLVMKEWNNCSATTRRLLILALMVLVAAVLLLTYGNYLGGV
jgi:L-rhamnose-H+ transport protein